MLINKNNTDIVNQNSLNTQFNSATLQDISQNCKILNSNFYLDSFNYFPISKDFETFHTLFKRNDQNSLDHFYTKAFYENLIEKKNNFKVLKDSFVLGSSPSDNYYTNLFYFFPRIFFINEKKLKVLIHRNLSNNFRNLILFFCKARGVQVSFNFIDDGFYKFENCLMPQFFKIEESIKILKFFIELTLPNVASPNFRPKIYIRRGNANYRKIINEADLIERLRKKDFEIINPEHFEILEQMKIFSNANIIISSHGSNLSNIVFCKKGTKIIEISPNIQNESEKFLFNRYKNISNIVGLQHMAINADTVAQNDYPPLVKKYIDSEILTKSNYYKNLILKVSEIEKLISNL